MEIIIHRINTIKKLTHIRKGFGTEIDIKSYKSKLILNHEPFKSGDLLENYLSAYNNGTLILNIKESGIEDEVIRLVKLYNIKSYFLLDCEMPYIFQKCKTKFKKIAIRYSEYEPIQISEKFINKVDWIWIDTYTKLPIKKNDVKIIKKFKSCLVCPERWGREKDIEKYFNKMIDMKFMPTSVMTSKKNSLKWLKLVNKKVLSVK
jgi:hypothetical protein